MAHTVKAMVRSADGVSIAYKAQGGGEPALVFIHGGFADSSFWRYQLDAFQGFYRVIALDLAGHGTSGGNRREWTLRAFAEDVYAVIEGEKVSQAVLIGNSMGGPVALEAARLIHERVIAVVGVDSLQDASMKWTPEQWDARVEATRKDLINDCKGMIRKFFHEEADPALVAYVKRKMCAMTPDLATKIMSGFASYDMGKAMRAVSVPIRSINGNLYPTNVAGNRAFSPGYDAIVLQHTGHFPMLESPDEFNKSLAVMLQNLTEEK